MVSRGRGRGEVYNGEWGEKCTTVSRGRVVRSVQRWVGGGRWGVVYNGR